MDKNSYKVLIPPVKKRPTRDPSILEYINKYPTNTILRSDVVSERTAGQINIPQPREFAPVYEKHLYDVTPPRSFEGRKVWKQFLSRVLNQKQCGSCWAFASTSSLSDRFNLFSRGQIHVDLSPIRLLICDTQGLEQELADPFTHPEQASNLLDTVSQTYGCRGNTLFSAWRYLFVTGTNTQECLPLYVFDETTVLPSCIDLTSTTFDMCIDHYFNPHNNVQYGTPAKFYNALFIYSVQSPEMICREIFKYGPVSTAMEMYPDLYTFDPTTTIYQWNGKGERQGGHAVVIDGWGEEDGVPFWWVRNSWGEEWGLNGYFRIRRGVNECKIEENVIAGIPNLNFQPTPSFFQDLELDANDVSNKIWVYSPSGTGGGIDVNTGFSHRVLEYEKYRPLVLANGNTFDNFDRFTAGLLISSVNRSMSSRMMESSSSSRRWLWIVLVVILVFVVTRKLFLFQYNK